jgi:hypothetical protein
MEKVSRKRNCDVGQAVENIYGRSANVGGNIRGPAKVRNTALKLAFYAGRNGPKAISARPLMEFFPKLLKYSEIMKRLSKFWEILKHARLLTSISQERMVKKCEIQPLEQV